MKKQRRFRRNGDEPEESGSENDNNAADDEYFETPASLVRHRVVKFYQDEDGCNDDRRYLKKRRDVNDAGKERSRAGPAKGHLKPNKLRKAYV